MSDYENPLDRLIAEGTPAGREIERLRAMVRWLRRGALDQLHDGRQAPKCILCAAVKASKELVP